MRTAFFKNTSGTFRKAKGKLFFNQTNITDTIRNCVLVLCQNFKSVSSVFIHCTFVYRTYNNFGSAEVMFQFRFQQLQFPQIQRFLNSLFLLVFPEAYLEPSPISAMELFCKNSLRQLQLFHVRLGSKTPLFIILSSMFASMFTNTSQCSKYQANYELFPTCSWLSGEYQRRKPAYFEVFFMALLLRNSSNARTQENFVFLCNSYFLIFDDLIQPDN